jgi:hypothetical protein
MPKRADREKAARPASARATDSGERAVPHVRRVVFTGGPAAGKTAILDVLQRHLSDKIAVLPESATTLFTGGFPRPSDAAGKRLVQQAIFTVQRSLEGIFAIEHPDRPHICDRGGLDGAAYWPGGLERFLGAMGTTLDSEYRRYDAVIFLETSAQDPKSYPPENPHRVETPSQARSLDRSLRQIWQGHPKFFFVGHEVRFYEKVAACLLTLSNVLDLSNHDANRSGRTGGGAGRARRPAKAEMHSDGARGPKEP